MNQGQRLFVSAVRALADDDELLAVGGEAITAGMAEIRGDDIDAMKLTTIDATIMLMALRIALKAIADKLEGELDGD